MLWSELLLSQLHLSMAEFAAAAKVYSSSTCNSSPKGTLSYPRLLRTYCCTAVLLRQKTHATAGPNRPQNIHAPQKQKRLGTIAQAPPRHSTERARLIVVMTAPQTQQASQYKTAPLNPLICPRFLNDGFLNDGFLKVAMGAALPASPFPPAGATGSTSLPSMATGDSWRGAHGPLRELERSRFLQNRVS